MKSTPLSILGLFVFGAVLIFSGCSLSKTVDVSTSGKETTPTTDLSAADQKIHAEAIAAQNESACGEITDPAYEQDCRARVLSFEASTKNDVSFCKKITNSVDRESCENNIFFALAGEKLDAQICLKITVLEQQKLCQESVRGLKQMKKDQAAGKPVLPPDLKPDSPK